MPLEIGSTVVQVLCELVVDKKHIASLNQVRTAPLLHAGADGSSAQSSEVKTVSRDRDSTTDTTPRQLEQPHSSSQSLSWDSSSQYAENQVTPKRNKVDGSLTILMVNESCYAVFFQPKQPSSSSKTIDVVKSDNVSSCGGEDTAVGDGSSNSNGNSKVVGMDVDVDSNDVPSASSNADIDAEVAIDTTVVVSPREEAALRQEEAPIFSADLDCIKIFPQSNLVHFPAPNDFYVVMPEALEFKMFQDAVYECHEIINATLRIQAMARDTYFAGLYRNLSREDMLRPMALSDQTPSRDTVSKMNSDLESHNNMQLDEEAQAKSSKGGGEATSSSSNGSDITSVSESTTKTMVDIVCTFCDISSVNDRSLEFMVHPFVNKTYQGKSIHMCVPCVVNWNRYRTALDEEDGLILPQEDNEELCAICSDTPDQLVLCGTCKRSFCTPCLIRVCNAQELASVNEDDDWSCMCCFHKDQQAPLANDKWKLVSTSVSGKSTVSGNRPGQLYRRIQELSISQTRRLQAIATTAVTESSSGSKPKRSDSEELPSSQTLASQNSSKLTKAERNEIRAKKQRDQRAQKKEQQVGKKELVPVQREEDEAAESEVEVYKPLPLPPLLALSTGRAKGPLVEARLALLALHQQQSAISKVKPKKAPEAKLMQGAPRSSSSFSSSSAAAVASVALPGKRQRQISSRVLANVHDNGYISESALLEAGIRASLKDCGKQPRTQSNKKSGQKKKPYVNLVSRAPSVIGFVNPYPDIDSDDIDGDAPETVIVCDGCDAEFFIRDIGITQVPDDDWYCNHCIEVGVPKRKKKRPSTVEAKKVTKLKAPPPPPARGTVVVAPSASSSTGGKKGKRLPKTQVSEHSDTWYFHKYVIVADDLVHENEIYENHTEDGFETEEACFLCKDGGDSLFQCDHCMPNCEVRNYRSGDMTTVPGRCRKVYHGYCLLKSPDVSTDDEWRCPRHYCDGCGTTKLDFVCRYCPISFCGDCKSKTKIFDRYVELDRPKFGWEFFKKTKPICCGNCLDLMDQCVEEGMALTANGATHPALLKRQVSLRKPSEAPRFVGSSPRGPGVHKPRQVVALSKQMKGSMEKAQKAHRKSSAAMEVNVEVEVEVEQEETNQTGADLRSPSHEPIDEERDEDKSPVSSGASSSSSESPTPSDVGVTLSWSDLKIDDSFATKGSEEKNRKEKTDAKKPRARSKSSEKLKPDAAAKQVNEDTKKVSAKTPVDTSAPKKPKDKQGRKLAIKEPRVKAAARPPKPPVEKAVSKPRAPKVPVDEDTPKKKRGRPFKVKPDAGNGASPTKVPKLDKVVKAVKVSRRAKPAHKSSQKPKAPQSPPSPVSPPAQSKALAKVDNDVDVDDGVSHMMRDVLNNPDADQPSADLDAVSFRIPIPQSDDTEFEGYSSMAMAHI